MYHRQDSLYLRWREIIPAVPGEERSIDDQPLGRDDSPPEIVAPFLIYYWWVTLAESVTHHEAFLSLFYLLKFDKNFD